MEQIIVILKKYENRISIMRDLEQLLRYEIPGFLIILYFLAFSWDMIKKIGICYGVAIKLLPGLVAAAAILALPLGYLAFNLYFACEERTFLARRAGTREDGVVRQILERYPAPAESNWWQRGDPSMRNEVLDIIFYSSNDNSEAAHILERFITFYHSGRVIGMYAPVLSIILHLILPLFLASHTSMDLGYIIPRCIAVAILYGGYYCIIIWGRIPESRPSRIIEILPIVVVLFILLINLINPILSLYFENPIYSFLLLLLVIWFISIPRTLEGGMLKRRIDELETNILLSRQQEIVKAIRRRLNETYTSKTINCL